MFIVLEYSWVFRMSFDGILILSFVLYKFPTSLCSQRDLPLSEGDTHTHTNTNNKKLYIVISTVRKMTDK